MVISASIINTSMRGSSAGTGVVADGAACTVPVAVAEHGAGVFDGAHVTCALEDADAVFVMLTGGFAAIVAVTV